MLTFNQAKKAGKVDDWLKARVLDCCPKRGAIQMEKVVMMVADMIKHKGDIKTAKEKKAILGWAKRGVHLLLLDGDSYLNEDLMLEAMWPEEAA